MKTFGQFYSPKIGEQIRRERDLTEAVRCVVLCCVVLCGVVLRCVVLCCGVVF